MNYCEHIHGFLSVTERTTFVMFIFINILKIAVKVIIYIYIERTKTKITEMIF